MKTDIALSAKGVNKYFHEPATFQVLKDMSFEVKKGEFLSMVGKSGSGKSTLLYVLSTMDTDYEGELQINGEALTGKMSWRLSEMPTLALCSSFTTCCPSFRPWTT